MTTVGTTPDTGYTGQLWIMRQSHCGQRQGLIRTVTKQDTVRCAVCGRWVYNAPRTETGRPHG